MVLTPMLPGSRSGLLDKDRLGISIDNKNDESKPQLGQSFKDTFNNTIIERQKQEDNSDLQTSSDLSSFDAHEDRNLRLL